MGIISMDKPICRGAANLLLPRPHWPPERSPWSCWWWACASRLCTQNALQTGQSRSRWTRRCGSETKDPLDPLSRKKDIKSNRPQKVMLRLLKGRDNMPFPKCINFWHHKWEIHVGWVREVPDWLINISYIWVDTPSCDVINGWKGSLNNPPHTWWSNRSPYSSLLTQMVF